MNVPPSALLAEDDATIATLVAIFEARADRMKSKTKGGGGRGR